MKFFFKIIKTYFEVFKKLLLDIKYNVQQTSYLKHQSSNQPPQMLRYY